MPIMIWIATIIEGAIENWADFGILLAIQFINATLGWYETTKAGDAVAALKASLKPLATAKRDGKWTTLDAGSLVPGDLVLLGSGSAVPADCLINHGTIDVDQSALTGESLPVTMHKGNSAKMGSMVVRGEVEATVEFTGKNTFFGKTASMLQQDTGMGHLQKMLLKIMMVLVGLSIVLCFTCFGYLLGTGISFRESISFTVVLLVASIPIAIEIVCTTTLALGSRQMATMGAIVTRLAAIEDLAGMNMLCSDKTGTLTLNKMVIQEDTPTFMAGVDQRALLRYAAMAAKWKEPPRDALDTLVLTTVDMASMEGVEMIDYMPFDPTIKRTEGTVIEDGKTFRTTKGAPNIIFQLCDDQAMRKAADTLVQSFGQRGIRALAVAISRKEGDDFGPWELVGMLTFLDPPRPDTKETVRRAMEFGVDVKMITGDHVLIAKETSRVLGLGLNVKDAKGLPSMGEDGKVPKDLHKTHGAMMMEADGFAQVYPEHKYLIVETLRQCGLAVGMTGDGVNDAPALKRADVGVAVQGATDAARAAADIVLTEPGLSTIVEGMVIARRIFQRMKTFINYRIAATLQLLFFFFIALFSFKPIDYYPGEAVANEEPWPEFFSLPVIMLMLITILNDGTLISIGYDNVNPSHMPEKWNLRALFMTSIILGVVAMGSSLLLLWACLDSYNPDGIFQKWGLPGLPYGKIITSIYLKVSISDFLTLFSARTHEGLFWTSRPSVILLICAGLALTISTILGSLWPKGQTDHVPTEGLALGDYTLMPLWIWVYCIVWWWIQDVIKVCGYWVMHRFNIFNINTDKLVNMRAAEAANDKKHKLARNSVGLVEGKLLNAKIQDAIEKVEHAEKAAAPGIQRKSLQRVSAGLRMSRVSGQPIGKGDAEAGRSVEDVHKQVEQLQQVVDAEIKGPAGEEIRQDMESIKKTAARLMIARKSASRQ
mmetsp:Transcript_14681/g.43032  ORF Transcript_14681/g.43032 Transcript_14681/m.43032 type:complete len:940 (+) Transcript_14681:400-3219(+)